MTSDLAKQIASTLEAELQLLPVLPDLLADLWELGASADDVVSALRSAGVRPGDTALDLGCGKGAVSVALAEQLGLQVEGIDGLPAFLQCARALAASRGVEAGCTFREADIRDLLGTTAQYDIVLLLSLGPVSGNHRKTVQDLRRLVQPAGLMVIDDAFLADGASRVPEYEGYGGHSEVLNQLTAFGDRLVEEVVYSPEETRAINRRNTDLIRRQATLLKARCPNLSGELDRFVARQEHETQLLGNEVIGALWVLRRVEEKGDRDHSVGTLHLTP